MNKTLITFLATMTVAGAAFAEVADTDGNGLFSMEEMVAAYADLTAETFAQIDTDTDGSVSPDELAAAIAAGVIAE